MFKYINPFWHLEKWMWRVQDPELFAKLYNSNIKYRRKWAVKIVPHEKYSELFDKYGRSIKILSHKRISKYKKGIRERLNSLLDDYFIDLIGLKSGDTVIDCGANIGEIGVGLRDRFGAINYIAFEPGQNEFQLCQLNNPGASCQHLALWNTNDTLQFFTKPDSADSSLIEFNGYQGVTEVQAKTLDSYCQESNLSTIHFLKIEAEGAEPEILEGAQATLEHTRFVAVDCGFERGHERQSTLPQVSNFLLKNGFEMIGVRKHRLTVLFKNKNFSQSESD